LITPLLRLLISLAWGTPPKQANALASAQKILHSLRVNGFHLIISVVRQNRHKHLAAKLFTRFQIHAVQFLVGKIDHQPLVGFVLEVHHGIFTRFGSPCCFAIFRTKQQQQVILDMLAWGSIVSSRIGGIV